MEDFIAVLVLYKTKLQQSATFNSVSESLKLSGLALDIVVYDNTPEFNPELQNGVTTEVNPNVRALYRSDSSNPGVSLAYNFGYEVALAKGKKWILLLDQDTEFPVNAISSYVDAVKQYPDDKLFAPVMLVDSQTIISPCRFKFMRGFSLKDIAKGANSLEQLSVINCGMCISVTAFAKNGGYNPLIKLDFSDHDFVKRFKEANGPRFIVLDLRVQHQLSSASKNSMQSDLTRFRYYLEGARNISASGLEKAFLTANAFIRAAKLSVIHSNLTFLTTLLK